MKVLSAIFFLLGVSAATAMEPVHLNCVGLAQVCSGSGEARQCGYLGPPAVSPSLLEVSNNSISQHDELKFLEFDRCARESAAISCTEAAADGSLQREMTIDRRSGRIIYRSHGDVRAMYMGQCEVRRPITNF